MHKRKKKRKKERERREKKKKLNEKSVPKSTASPGGGEGVQI